MKKLISTILALGMCIGLTSCSDEVLSARKPEQESVSASSEPESIVNEPVNEKTENESESSEERSDEPEKYYIYEAVKKQYDVASIAEYLIDEECDIDEIQDSVTGEKTISYSIIGKHYLDSWNDNSFVYERSSVASCFIGIAETCRDINLNYQQAHLKNLFPYDPENQQEYTKAKEASDHLAELTGITYDIFESYYIDNEFLTEKLMPFYNTGGPAWRMENRRLTPSQWSEPYWNEDEAAFLFVYRISHLDDIPLADINCENSLIVYYAVNYGICYVKCPEMYEVVGKEEVEIRTEEETLNEFRRHMINAGILEDTVRIESTEVIYSAFEFLNVQGEKVEIKPYRKFNFTSTLSDADLESSVEEDLFRGQNHSEWYLIEKAVR